MSVWRSERGRFQSRPHVGRGTPLRLLLLVAALAAGLSESVQASMEDITAKFKESREAAKAGELEKAAQLSSEALTLAETELGKDNSQTGILAYNTGVLYVAIEKWSEARAPLEAALENYAKVHGEVSPRLLPVMDKLVEVYTGLEALDPGYALVERKLLIVEKDKGEESKEAADALVQFAGAAGLKGKHKLARRQFRKALRIYESSVGEKSAEVGRTYIGMAFNELQDPETGASKLELVPKYLTKGVGILEEVYPQGSPELIGLFDFMAAGYRNFPGPQSEAEAEKFEAKAAEQRRLAEEKKASSAEAD